ncbi:MAG TPA: hypothetical protein VHR84_11445 [Terriglobales bacterium]|jgi:hypothetical protein|nr:hypothetical protein [Terriglobales bacterium]
MYQPVQGAKRNINGSFVVITGNEVGFQIANYDRSRALIIDPILSYSTYLGGSGYESNQKSRLTPPATPTSPAAPTPSTSRQIKPFSRYSP